jgi:hypothetical protein
MGMWCGGELGGDGVRMGELGTEVFTGGNRKTEEGLKDPDV